jgi:hypothetical protein
MSVIFNRPDLTEGEEVHTKSLALKDMCFEIKRQGNTVHFYALLIHCRDCLHSSSSK